MEAQPPWGAAVLSAVTVARRTDWVLVDHRAAALRQQVISSVGRPGPSIWVRVIRFAFVGHCEPAGLSVQPGVAGPAMTPRQSLRSACNWPAFLTFAIVRRTEAQGLLRIIAGKVFLPCRRLGDGTVEEREAEWGEPALQSTASEWSDESTGAAAFPGEDAGVATPVGEAWEATPASGGPPASSSVWEEPARTDDPAPDGDATVAGADESEDVYVPPLTWAGALGRFAAAERRAAAVLDESRVAAEAIRLRGKREAREIIQHAEERARQIMDLSERAAEGTERRARSRSQAILVEAQLRLDVFAQDHGEPPPDDDLGADGFDADAEDDTAREFMTSDVMGATGSDTRAESEQGVEGSVATLPPPQGLAGADQTRRNEDADSGEESEWLVLAPLPADGATANYRVTGPLTFARIMAIEQVLRSLDGVETASVTPESNNSASISFVSGDPPETVEGLLLAIPALHMGGPLGD